MGGRVVSRYASIVEIISELEERSGGMGVLANVLQLGEVADLEALKFNLALMFI